MSRQDPKCPLMSLAKGCLSPYTPALICRTTLFWRRSMCFTGKFCATMLMVALSATLAAAVTPTLTLTPNIDPPSGVGAPVIFQVAATGFPDSAAVGIYFDTTDVALAVTSATGTFSAINVQVPASAVPGTHWVSAVARNAAGTA